MIGAVTDKRPIVKSSLPSERLRICNDDSIFSLCPDKGASRSALQVEYVETLKTLYVRAAAINGDCKFLRPHLNVLIKFIVQKKRKHEKVRNRL